MDKKKSLLIKMIGFIVNLIILLTLVLLFIENMLIIEIFLALIFIQTLGCGFLLFLYYIYKQFDLLAKSLGFSFLKGTFLHPKFEGHYKDNWWQLHFVSKETGRQWGIPKTYVKLQWKKLKHFNDAKLRKYDASQYKGCDILKIKHITRDYKNYLLLKTKWFIFDKRKIHDLMDLLLKVAKEAEIKK